MMRSVLSYAATIALALSAVITGRASDATTLIDFESNAEFEVITDQFIAEQIRFSNVIVLQSFTSLNEIDFPPSSGVHAISGLGPGAAVIEFTQPARLFSAHLTTGLTATITSFLADGTILTDTVAPNLGAGELYTLTFGDQQLLRVEIANGLPLTPNAFSLTLDDVVFAIPEPSALLVMGIGLLPVSAAIRRRARA